MNLTHGPVVRLRCSISRDYNTGKPLLMIDFDDNEEGGPRVRWVDATGRHRLAVAEASGDLCDAFNRLDEAITAAAAYKASFGFDLMVDGHIFGPDDEGDK